MKVWRGFYWSCEVKVCKEDANKDDMKLVVMKGVKRETKRTHALLSGWSNKKWLIFFVAQGAKAYYQTARMFSYVLTYAHLAPHALVWGKILFTSRMSWVYFPNNKLLENTIDI